MEGFIKDIYKKSPIWLQNVIISGYGYKIHKERYGEVYFNTYNGLISKDFTDFSKEIKNQEIELSAFLKHVVSNSTFYKELYSDIDLESIKTVNDLQILPIVDKELLRENIEKVYTINENDGVVSYTGGTTGKSLKVIFTKDDFQKRMAYLDAFKHRIGITDPFHSRKATFSGRDFIHSDTTNIFWRYNRAYRQRLYSTFHLSEQNMSFYVDNLNTFKPEILNGFVSAIYELSEFIDRKQLQLAFIPKAIFTTSETLLPHHRELIEKVFKSKIYNQYASAEGAPFITECIKGNLHYNIDTGVIETLDTDYGSQMIVTSFSTKGTPLVRYNIGDTITFKDGGCSCGSSHPLVLKIEGRKVDYLYSIEKGKISLSHLADVIKGIPNSIKKMQFVQKSKDVIDILIVVDSARYNSEHHDSILKEMEYRFGKQMTVNIEEVDEIPREKSGKFSLIKNYL